MATKRILHDDFRVLLAQFGRLKKADFTHKMYYSFFEWPLTAFLFGVACPVVGGVKHYFFDPKGDDYHRFFKTYQVKRVKEPS